MTTTDADGRFSFKNVAPARSYVVEAEREGYFRQPLPETPPLYDDVWSSREARSVTVTAGKPTPDVVFNFVPGSVIAGIVRDSRGQALSNFSVAAFTVKYRQGRALLNAQKTEKTDDRGEYRLFLPPGSYFIAAIPRPLPRTPSSQDALVRTFLPGEIDTRLAKKIAVALGAVLERMDIQVRADAIAKVSGRIVNPFVDASAESRAPQDALYLVSRNPAALDDNAVVSFFNWASVTGQFEIQNVPPGSYDLWARAADGNGRTLWGRSRVDISNRDVTNVVIAIKPGTELRIRVTVNGAAPAPATPPPAPARNGGPPGSESGRGGRGVGGPGGATPRPTAEAAVMTSIRVRLSPREAGDGAFANSITTSANASLTYDAAGGFYVLPNVPEGKYDVSVTSLASGGYVEDIRLSGASVFDEGLLVSGSTADAQIFISTNSGSVAGRLLDAEGRPVVHGLIALVPQQSRRGNPALYKSALTSQFYLTSDTRDASRNGQYSIGTIPPGEYKIFGWDRLPSDGAWQNANFIAQFEQYGKAVTITAGAQSSVDLTVVPQPRKD
jgi:hypothetical protein